AVAPQRVDLAVVRQQPERLGQRPAGRRIGRVALMEYGQCRLEVRRLQVGEERAELGPGEQGLINDGAPRQAADEERLEPGPRLGHSGIARLARELGRPLPRGGVATPVPGRTYEHLTHSA